MLAYILKLKSVFTLALLFFLTFAFLSQETFHRFICVCLLLTMIVSPPRPGRHGSSPGLSPHPQLLHTRRQPPLHHPLTAPSRPDFACVTGLF